MKTAIELYQDLMANLNRAEAAGINEYQGRPIAEFRVQAAEDLQDRLLAEQGVDLDEEDEEDYDDDTVDIEDFIAEGLVGNRFGGAILELAEEMGYTTVDDVVIDLANATNNTIEDTLGLITGATVPNEDLAVYTANLFELDEDTATDLVNAAYEAGGIEDEDKEDEEEYEGDDEEDAQYSSLNARIAEFETKEVIRDSLATLEAKARDVMPPAALRLLFGTGNFNTESDRIAAFTSIAQRSGVDIDTELYAMSKTVEVFESLGLNETGLFNSYAALNEANFSENNDEDKAAEEQARRNRELRNERRHNIG
jgi:hypothetical protein